MFTVKYSSLWQDFTLTSLPYKPSNLLCLRRLQELISNKAINEKKQATSADREKLALKNNNEGDTCVYLSGFSQEELLFFYYCVDKRLHEVALFIILAARNYSLLFKKEDKGKQPKEANQETFRDDLEMCFELGLEILESFEFSLQSAQKYGISRMIALNLKYQTKMYMVSRGLTIRSTTGDMNDSEKEWMTNGSRMMKIEKWMLMMAKSLT